jgi:uncharacterized membrane protein YcaP (DUF421 family)
LKWGGTSGRAGWLFVCPFFDRLKKSLEYMKKEEIEFWDINRWLFGMAPPEFMIEVFIRTVLIFIILLMVVRVMGHRMAGQMTLTEMSVMITLGAIVSPAMQLPDRGLLFGVVALGCAYVFQRGLNLLAFKHEKIEKLTQGKLSLLVKDGQLNREELAKTRVSRQQLYAMLREKEIYNLGEVERLYLEACGLLSIYKMKEAKPGLPISPGLDPKILDIQELVNSGQMACQHCGHVQQVIEKEMPCEICKSSEWTHAYIAPASV